MEESIAPSKKASVLEHLSACGMKLPEVALSGRPVLPGNLYEAVVEAEVVADGVLPRRPPLSVVRELLNDVVAYFSQGEHLVWRLGDCHGYESNVGVRRLDVVLVALRGGVRFLSAFCFLGGISSSRSSRFFSGDG